MKIQGHIVIRRRAKNGNDGKPGDDGSPGKDGLPGCIQRQSEWATGVEYRNDEALTSGTRYLDIVIVITGANTFNVYKCLKTHISSNSIPVTNTTYWQKFNTLQPVYTPFIIAPNAILHFMQGNQLLIMKSDNKTVAAGLIGGEYPFWIGGEKPTEAPLFFGIEGNGKLANGNMIWDKKGNVELNGSISLPYKCLNLVGGNNILDLSNGRYFLACYDNPYNFHNISLPTPSEKYNGAEVRIYSGFMTTRSSKSSFTLTVDGGGVIFYPGYQPFTSNLHIEKVTVTNREIILRCISINEKFNFWFLQNYNDFSSSDFNGSDA